MEPDRTDANFSSLFIPYPNFRLFDKNSNELTNFNFSKSEDNQSLQINFSLESPDRFTFQLGGNFGESLDGAVSQPETFSLAYGRPLTRLDHLRAWWDLTTKTKIWSRSILAVSRHFYR